MFGSVVVLEAGRGESPEGEDQGKDSPIYDGTCDYILV